MVAAASVDVTVDHGLGKSPVIPIAGVDGGSLVHVVTVSTSSTQIVYRVQQSDNVARTQSGTVYWLALG